MKHKDILNQRYGFLKTKGIKIDPHHHTHSRYDYEDGIAINKGDWLKNEWCKGICNVVTKERLDALLLKQGLFERVCGYATTKAQLYWYLLEYYCTCIDYDPDFNIEGLGDNLNWEDKIREATDKAWEIPLEEIDTAPMKDNSKVHIDVEGKDRKEIGRLAKEGERRYNRYRIEDFIKRNPDKSKQWYINHFEEIGVFKNTVKKYFGYR